MPVMIRIPDISLGCSCSLILKQKEKESIYFLFCCPLMYLFVHFKAPPKKVPKTIENQRVYDETMVDPEDEEVRFTFKLS